MPDALVHTYYIQKSTPNKHRQSNIKKMYCISLYAFYKFLVTFLNTHTHHGSQTGRYNYEQGQM